MEIQYVHVKTRAQFGKQCIFEDEGPKIDEHLLPNRELMSDYVYRNPCHIGVQNSKQFAVHEVQTMSALTRESGMSHTEGGWPKEMNPKDEEATARFRRRIEKDDIWPVRMKKLLEPMEHCILQNNAINIYENFFDDMVTTELVLPLDVRTVNVYEDPQTMVRPITHLSWSPDHGKRLAVSYCSTEFESEPVDRNPCSYIWEIENPNKPFMELKATCPSVVIEFNPRDPSMLISGLMSGQVCNWDIRQGDKPVQISHLQFSHRNPTNLALWINSKTNTEFFSASTGGAIKWWDLRKLREPTETLVMDLENPMRGDVVRAIGVASLQYEPIMGTKFMAGMENGIVVSGTRKGKNAQEKLALRFACHEGPILAIDRNPFSTKNFLTVGGWVARIWAEDTREGNLTSIKRDKIALTGGAWSKSRYSVFYLIDESGVMRIYDLLVGLKSPVKTISLCENRLNAIAPHEEGIVVAVGSEMGKVYLVEASEGLTTNMQNDKLLMSTYLDRCSRYIKAVDNRIKEAHLSERITEVNSTEQLEDTNQSNKRKTRGFGTEVRVMDINTSEKKIDDKSSKVGSVDEKDKKIKMKKFKEASSGDPDLDDAEARYYEIINKETEKYAEIAALEESTKEGFSVSVSSQPVDTKRRKQEDSKMDKERMSAPEKRPLSVEKQDEKDKMKGRKSRTPKIAKPEVKIEEIVIMRKRKGDKEEDDETEKHIAINIKKDEDGLDGITNEYETGKRMIDETKKLKDLTKKDKDDMEFRDKSKRSEAREKTVKMKKPCDSICQPEICCADEKVKKSREGNGKRGLGLRTPGVVSDTDIMINEMLLNLPKVASPDELGHLLDPIDENTIKKEKLILAKKDARPRILDKDIKIAKEEVQEWQESIIHRRSTMPVKLQRYKETKIEDSSVGEILQESDVAIIQREDSKSAGNLDSGFDRIFFSDEDLTRERENYTRQGKRRTKDKKKKVKMPIDCEPVTVKFDEKEIKKIIGIPDAPRPPSRPRFDESTIKITKTKGDYPRISAAAIPVVVLKNESLSQQEPT